MLGTTLGSQDISRLSLSRYIPCELSQVRSANSAEDFCMDGT
jgi:hypothetical protein